MYKGIKFFNLIEESFLLLKKTTKKIWIIGMIISVLSGAFIINETIDYSFYPETAYDEEYAYDDTAYDEEYTYDDTALSEEIATFGEESVSEFGIFGFIFLAIILILMIVLILVIALLVSTAMYYLCKSIYEILYDKKIDRAPLGLVVKVNSIVLLKVMLGLIFFVVPGIIIALKYAPLNYILCKYPELSSKEILTITRDMSKGLKWKMFIFTTLIFFIEVVIMLLTSPNMFVSGYIGLDILTSILTFIVSTIMIVFTGLFDMNFFISVDNIKYPNTECN